MHTTIFVNVSSTNVFLKEIISSFGYIMNPAAGWAEDCSAMMRRWHTERWSKEIKPNCMWRKKGAWCKLGMSGKLWTKGTVLQSDWYVDRYMCKLPVISCGICDNQRIQTYMCLPVLTWGIGELHEVGLPVSTCAYLRSRWATCADLDYLCLPVLTWEVGQLHVHSWTTCVLPVHTWGTCVYIYTLVV